MDLIIKEYEFQINSQTEISKFLKEIWKDIKKRIGPWKKLENLYFEKNIQNFENEIPYSLDDLSSFEREKIIKYLISQLHLKMFSPKLKFEEEIENKKKEKKNKLVLPPINQRDSTKFRNRLKQYNFLVKNRLV